MTIAVIKTGGKQYKVAEKSKIKVEKLAGEIGAKISFSDVLLIADDKGETAKIGQPTISGAKVEAKILNQAKDKKVRVVKWKSKTRQRKIRGHRQPFTEIEIEKIS